MINYIVTVRMLKKNPAHNPQAKVTGDCPVTGRPCTDVTGEHHSFLRIGMYDEAEVRESIATVGKGIYRLTRLEEIA